MDLIDLGKYFSKGKDIFGKNTKDNDLLLPIQYMNNQLNIKPINPELMGIYSGEDLFNIYPKSKDQVYILNHVFFCENYEGKIKFTDGEVKDLKWFDLDNLPENIFKVNKPIINDVKKFVSDRKVIVK